MVGDRSIAIEYTIEQNNPLKLASIVWAQKVMRDLIHYLKTGLLEEIQEDLTDLEEENGS